MIREATITDSERIVNLSIESVSKRGPILPVNFNKICALVVGAIYSKTNYVFVDETDGQIDAVIGAIVHTGFWFDGDQADVMVFYSRNKAGGGHLIRHFSKWVKARPNIKMASFSLEPDVDQRISAFLKRLGFLHEHPQLAMVKS